MLTITLPVEITIARDMPPPTEADILAMGKILADLRVKLDVDATRWYREWEERADRSAPIEPFAKSQDTRLWDVWLESGMPLPMHQPIGLTYVGD